MCVEELFLTRTDTDDFLKEINFLVIANNGYKLHFEVKHTKSNIDWRKCSSQLVQNLIRKITAVVPEPESEDGRKNIDTVVQIYMDYYLKGIKILNLLQSKLPDFYEKLIELKSICEDEVQVKCCISNPQLDSNTELFKNIIEDFGDRLKSEFGQAFSLKIVEELKNQIISSWLLYCPMNFR